MTWPLTLRLTTAVADLGDPLLNAWILDWDCHALLHAPWRIFDAPVFYPSKYPLAYSENMIAVAALVLPFKLAGLPAIGLHNVAMLLGFTLSAYAGFILAQLATRNPSRLSSPACSTGSCRTSSDIWPTCRSSGASGRRCCSRR